MRYIYAHLYIVSIVLAMVYVRHASHLQAREQNGRHFVYSKLIVKKHDSGWTTITL